MKRIICLVLCVVMMSFALVGCGDDLYDEILENIDKNGWTPEVVPEMELDLYVIFDYSFVDGAVDNAYDEAVAEKTANGETLSESDAAALKLSIKNDILEAINGAQTTVESRINKYLSKYTQDSKKLDLQKTTLKIHYLSEDEYMQTVLNDADTTLDKNGLPKDSRADIVLIAGEEMFNAMHSANKLACLDGNTSFTVSDAVLTAAPPFGTLYGSIADSLFTASKVELGNGISSAFCIPNNHIVGEYTYAVVNEKVAKAIYMGTDIVSQMVSEDCEATLTFMNALNSARAENSAEFAAAVAGIDLDNAVRFVSGTYADAQKYKDEGNYVVLVSSPKATKADAYSGAFAIVRHPYDVIDDPTMSKQKKDEINTYYNRCMEVIYELNTSVELRNLLQYGAANIHYEPVYGEDGAIYSVSYKDDGFYRMDLLYTGNINIAYYNEQLGWTENVYNYGLKQNKGETPETVLNRSKSSAN